MKLQQDSILIEIMHVTAPFGIKGAVRVFLYTDDIGKYRKVYDQEGHSFSFCVQSKKKDTAVVKFESVNDRNEAEKLKGMSFYVNREDMPGLDIDQFYVCDLIGKKVLVDGEDKNLTIVDVKNFGAGDLIEISEQNNPNTFYIPFTKENFITDEEFSITFETYKNYKVN